MEREREAQVVRWGYQYETWELNRYNLAASLNKLAAEGWRIVSVCAPHWDAPDAGYWHVVGERLGVG